jgi:hypothetical protein
MRCNKVEEVAENTMISLPDTSGTNIDVQILDTARDKWAKSSFPQAKLKKRTSLLYGLFFVSKLTETIDELETIQRKIFY